jgi:hypothetical protein
VYSFLTFSFDSKYCFGDDPPLGDHAPNEQDYEHSNNQGTSPEKIFHFLIGLASSILIFFSLHSFQQVIQAGNVWILPSCLNLSMTTGLFLHCTHVTGPREKAPPWRLQPSHCFDGISFGFGFRDFFMMSNKLHRGRKHKFFVGG